MKRFTGRFLFVISSIFAFCFVGLTILTLFGAYGRELELLTHLRVQILLPLLVVAPALLLVKARAILIAALIAICINLADIAPLYWPQSKSSRADYSLSILTLNVETSNTNYAGVGRLIEQQNADVVCLQELTPQMAKSLNENLIEYPYQFVEARDGYFGIGIFCKYALSDKQVLKLCSEDTITLRTTVDVRGRKITLVNTHTIAPLTGVYYEWRNKQLDALADIASQSNEPFILVGDLNVTYFSPFLKRLLSRGHLSDSEFGFGVQPSWSARKWPLSSSFDCFLFRLPLDHFLFKGGVSTLDRKLLSDVGSDHLPVLVKLGLPE